jgi:hypothetical protein
MARITKGLPAFVRRGEPRYRPSNERGAVSKEAKNNEK